MMIDFLQFLYLIISLVVVLSVHEASHALVAYYLGDPTAKLKGRLTLNPLAHLDLVGSLLFLITQRIGWGKPVPVNPANFKKPMRDSALTALAGPVSNFILSFALAFPLKYLWDYMPASLILLIWMIFDVSIVLGIFNMIPIPPLDGSKIIGLIIPRRYADVYERFLEKGVKYFVVIILIDVFILQDLIGFSFFRFLMEFFYERVRLILLLGT